MEPGFDLFSVLDLLVQEFPSLDNFVHVILPIVMGVFTLLSMISKIMPAPGTVYPIPDVSDLQAELGQDGPKFFLKLAKMTRAVVIMINWFIRTSLYALIYRVLTLSASIFSIISRKVVARRTKISAPEIRTPQSPDLMVSPPADTTTPAPKKEPSP